MPAPVTAQRERYVDLLRAASICAVVVGHWVVSAVEVGAGGRLVPVNLLDIARWTHPFTWLFQVMPVFFLVGGYANAASLSSQRRKGGTVAGWLRRRALRLLRPTALFVAVLVGVRLAALALGADDGQVRAATWAAVTPLWFLVVYLAVVLLAPVMERAHRRWGWRVVLALVAAVAFGDVLRLATGEPAPAAGNYLFGWLAVHQVGILWRDGRLPGTPRGAGAIAAGGLATALLLTGPGPYGVAMVGAAAPPDLTNTAPPTLALLALAAAQLGAVLLLRAPVSRWLARQRVWAAVIGLNAVVLSVFLWHMAVLVLGGALLVGTGLFPGAEPGSGVWFLWRIPWVGALTVLLLGVVAVVAPLENAPLPDPLQRPSALAVTAGILLAIAGFGALGVTDTLGLAPGVAGIPVVELTLVAAGTLLLERTGR